MKKLILLFSFLSAFVFANSQVLQKNNTWWEYKLLKADTFLIYSDTISLPTSLKTSNYALAAKNDILYMWSPAQLKWLAAGHDSVSLTTTWGSIVGNPAAQSDMMALFNAKVPKTTTLTFNGVAQDLSNNRSWGPFIVPADTMWLHDQVVNVTTYTNSLTFSDGLHQAGNNVVALHDEAHWNANKFQGRFVSTTTPINGQVYAWDSTNQIWKPTSVSGGGGGGTASLTDTYIGFGRNGQMTGSDSLNWGGAILTMKGTFSSIIFAKALNGRAGMTFFNNNTNYGTITTGGTANSSIQGTAIGDLSYRTEGTTDHVFSVAPSGSDWLVKFKHDSTISFKGIASYEANYGSLYSARSLVDKNYVDSSISAGGGGGGSSNFAKVYSSVSNVSTSGTTETDAYSFTIPANTLATDGDQLKFELVTENFTAGQPHTIRYYLFGTNFGLDVEYTNGEVITKVIVTRTSSSTADIELQMWGPSDTYGVPVISFATGLDWTASMVTKLTMQAPTSGSVTAHHVSINKEIQ